MTKILIIEDEEAIRESILDVLRLSKFDAIAAENGCIGIQLAHLHRPDLIICDIMMPEMDGYSVLTSLRQDPSLDMIPFIFLTAKVDMTDRRQGMKLGADDYLTKPIGRTELLDAIATRLEKQTTINNQLQHKLNALRSSITLSLPHEMRTPLSGILGLADILIDEHKTVAPEEILELAQDLKECGESLYKLIQNFLLYAELELASSDIHQIKLLQGERTVGIKSLITEIAHQKACESDRTHDLIVELEEAPLEAILCISSHRLQKAVEEVVDNAFRYSLPNTPIHIFSQLGIQNNTLTLCITDAGRGMTADQIASIGAYMQFERKLYEQQGSGLGLAIAQRLMQLHNGQLNIESKAGNGTKVCLVLPTS